MATDDDRTLDQPISVGNLMFVLSPLDIAVVVLINQLLMKNIKSNNFMYK